MLTILFSGSHVKCIQMKIITVTLVLYASSIHILTIVSLFQWFPLIPPGFFPADHPSEAGIRQVRALLQNSKEEPQQVPILPLPEVPVSGHVPQR